MTPAAAVPLPADSPKVALLRDFPDRLSPMLVKELRQGLKSHVFTWGLIAMQLSLIVMTLIAMEEGNSRDINAFFWWSVAGAVCVLLPLRSANALRDESGGNTLDTLLLTHLSAWRITLGKWLATCALQVLVAMTALPYLILRYFAGGIDLVMEAAWLGVYLLFGMLVSAVMLGLSWFPHFLARSVFTLAVLGGALGFCGGTIDEISRAYGYGLDEMFNQMGWPGVIYILTGMAWVAFFFLDIGAARLAPLSENRATRRRLVALAVLTIGSICCAATFAHREIAAILMMMLAMAMVPPAIQALCERPVNLAPVLQPFVRRGRPGRLAGRVLYPGWHTGLVFALLLILTAGGLAIYHFLSMMQAHGRMTSENVTEMCGVMFSITGGVLGTLVLPLVMWALLSGLSRWDFWRWLLVLVLAGLFHLFVTGGAIRSTSKLYYANYLLPTGALFLVPATEMQAREEAGEMQSAKDNWRSLYELRQSIATRLMLQHSLVAGCSLALWLAAAAMLVRRELRVTREAERELR